MNFPLFTEYSFYPEEKVIPIGHLENYLANEISYRGEIPSRIVKDTLSHLESFKNMFQHKEFDDFNQRYLHCIATFSFMSAIVDMKEDLRHRLDWRRSNFCSQMSEDPYMVSNPLDIFYIQSIENMKNQSVDDIADLESFHTNGQKDYGSFSDKTITRGRKALSEAEKKYTIADHFEGMLYGLVFPKLIGVKDFKLRSMQERYDTLCETYGRFMIKLPEFIS